MKGNNLPRQSEELRKNQIFNVLAKIDAFLTKPSLAISRKITERFNIRNGKQEITWRDPAIPLREQLDQISGEAAEVFVVLEGIRLNLLSVFDDPGGTVLRVHEALRGIRGELRTLIIPVGTQDDLIAVLKHPGVNHLGVMGHGTWGTWRDANLAKVTNVSLQTGLDGQGQKKATFFRLCCGTPDAEHHDFQDQLGAPLADAVYGWAQDTCFAHYRTDPLRKTDVGNFWATKWAMNNLFSNSFLRLFNTSIDVWCAMWSYHYRNVFGNALEKKND